MKIRDLKFGLNPRPYFLFVLLAILGSAFVLLGSSPETAFNLFHPIGKHLESNLSLYLWLTFGALFTIVMFTIRWKKRELAKQGDTRFENDNVLHLFSEAISATSDGMALTDISGTFIWANPGFCKMTGYSLGEIIGSNPRLFKSGKQDPSVYKTLWSTVLAGRTFSGDFVNKRKDGTLYTGEVIITPVHDRRGKVSHFSVMERDISIRVEREETLHQNQERFKTLVETMNDGLAMFDSKDHITYANPVFLSKLGFSGSEVVGFEMSRFLDEKNKNIVVEQRARRRKGHRQHYDLEMTSKSGTRKVFAISPSGLFNLAGEFVGSFAIFRDVTLDRESEEQFALALEKTESVNQFKISLLDNVSHEFRTPLSGIIGFADLLAESATSDQIEMISHIQSDSLRLLETINEVLDMSTVLSQNMVTNSKPCHITQEVLQAVRKWKVLAEKKQIVLRVDARIKEPQAELDKRCFERVVSHLLSNAIKFTEKGEVVVEIRDSRHDSAFFDLVVRDTGIGIDDTEQQRIFESFIQESSGVSRSHNGLGLGLSFTKVLVGQMGGEISVTSLKHIGSEFVVSLPRKPVSQPVKSEFSESRVVARPVSNGFQRLPSKMPVAS